MRVFSKIGIVSLALFFFVSCAGRLAFKSGEEAFRSKDWDKSVDHFLKAVQSDPDNPRYRLSLAKALIEASSEHVERGEKFLAQNELKLALIEFQKALDYNPEDLRAKKRKSEILGKLEQYRAKRTEKTEIEKIKERAAKTPLVRPILGPDSEKPVNLRFRDADLTEIFSTLQKTSGINFLYDGDFKSKKISIELGNVTFKEALERLVMISSLFYKIMDEKTILVIPDTPVKRREYEELVLKTFYISNGDVNQIQGLLRTLADIKIIAVNPELRTISLREPRSKIEIAEKIIASQDKAKAEVLIDVEILEVNKTRMRDYGIELSNYQITESLASNLSSSTSSSSGSSTGSLISGNMFYSLDSSDFLFSIPSISYKLLESDTKSKVIAKPQLRVLDGETVSLQLGDKVPSPMTSFVPIAMGGVNQQAITSFQLLDVGIKIEFTPRVHHNGDITLKLKFEMTFITTPGTATIPPTIGNRSVTTMIRMKDNETGLLAGLLRDTERKAQRGFPGINKIPILNKLFGGTNEEISQTDIILTLTPRISKMPDIKEEDLAPVWVGTEKNMGIKPAPARTPFEAPSVPEEKADKESGEKETEEEAPKEPIKEETQESLVSIMPPLTEVAPHIEFMEKITVENVANVAGLVCIINFDPQVLKVKDVKEGDFLKRDGTKTSFVKSVNEAAGEIQISVSREGFKEGVSGTGEIAWIIFEGLQEGKSTIAISKGSVRSNTNVEIPVAFLEGEVVVK